MELAWYARLPVLAKRSARAPWRADIRYLTSQETTAALNASRGPGMSFHFRNHSFEAALVRFERSDRSFREMVPRQLLGEGGCRLSIVMIVLSQLGEQFGKLTTIGGDQSDGSDGEAAIGGDEGGVDVGDDRPVVECVFENQFNARHVGFQLQERGRGLMTFSPFEDCRERADGTSGSIQLPAGQSHIDSRRRRIGPS